METIIWAILTILVQLSGGNPTGSASSSVDKYFSEYNVFYTGPSCPAGTQECIATFIYDNENKTFELNLDN